MTRWINAFQRFVWRISTSFFVTYMLVSVEFKAFGALHDEPEVMCLLWRNYITPAVVLWFCLHLLLHRKEPHAVE